MVEQVVAEGLQRGRTRFGQRQLRDPYEKIAQRRLDPQAQRGELLGESGQRNRCKTRQRRARRRARADRDSSSGSGRSAPAAASSPHRSAPAVSAASGRSSAAPRSWAAGAHSRRRSRPAGGSAPSRGRAAAAGCAPPCAPVRRSGRPGLPRTTRASAGPRLPRMFCCCWSACPGPRAPSAAACAVPVGGAGFGGGQTDSNRS